MVKAQTITAYGHNTQKSRLKLYVTGFEDEFRRFCFEIVTGLAKAEDETLKAAYDKITDPTNLMCCIIQ